MAFSYPGWISYDAAGTREAGTNVTTLKNPTLVPEATGIFCRVNGQRPNQIPVS